MLILLRGDLQSFLGFIFNLSFGGAYIGYLVTNKNMQENAGGTYLWYCHRCVE